MNAISLGRIQSGKNWCPIDIHELCTLTQAAPAKSMAIPTTTGDVENGFTAKLAVRIDTGTTPAAGGMGAGDAPGDRP